MKQPQRTWMIVTGILSFGVLSYCTSMHQAIILLLYAVIAIELYRTLWEFALKEDNRIKMRYVVDSAFVFLIKEQYLAWVLLKEDFDRALDLVIVYTSVMVIMVIIRIVLSYTSPSRSERIKD